MTMDISLLQASIDAQLSSEEADAFAQCFELRTYESGAIVVEQGAEQREAFIVEEGIVARERKIGSDARYSELQRRGRGGAIGFHHLLETDPSYARVEVVSERARLWVISHEEFQRHCLSSPSFLLKWCKWLNSLVRKQSNVVRALQQSTPEQRADESDRRISVVFFDASDWTKQAFDRPEITEHLHLRFFKEPLSLAATPLASGHRVVSCFVNCDLGAPVMRALSEFGVRMIAMRCAGFDRVCIDSARAFGLTVARVPAYSPYAVAEFALSLLMTLNRRVHTTCQRVRNGNFSLQGLVGFDVHGKTVGIIGTGKIGRCFANIMLGMGCKLLCYDVYRNEELAKREGVRYAELDEVLEQSDIISLHVPLLETTKHMINENSIAKMKRSCVLINTSRGGLVDSEALVRALQQNRIAGAAIDVYERESGVFFKDNSGVALADPTLVQLLALPNAVVSGHQAFLTKEALQNISDTTLRNIMDWKDGKELEAHPNSIY